MPVSVRDYLDSMRTVSSSQAINTKPADIGLDTKTQALLSQLIEALSYANSMDFRKKTLNKSVDDTGKTGKEFLQQLRAQEKLINQLIEGQRLSAAQNKELTSVIDKFYEFAGATEINYKKFAGQLEKFALKGNLPEAVQTRLINDSRDAHMIGKEQQDSSGVILPILKRIRNLLEDSRESTKQFGKKLFVTLDSFREGFLAAFDNLKDSLEGTGSFIDNIVDAVKAFGIAWMLLQKRFNLGDFKFGQIFKQIDNIKTAFKAFTSIAKTGVKVKGPIKVIKDLITGAKLMGKGLSEIPKAFKGLTSFGKVGGTMAKGITKGLGKNVLKKVPVVGTLMSLAMAFYRWKRKDYAGAFIEISSGLAAMIPGVGTAISIGLDLVNLGRDTGLFKKMGEKAADTAKGVTKGLGENGLLSIPLVGPIYGISKAISLFKKGQKQEGLKLIGKSLAAMAIPGGAFIADALATLIGKKFDVKPDKANDNKNSFNEQGAETAKKINSNPNSTKKIVGQKPGTSGTKVDDFIWEDSEKDKKKSGWKMPWQKGAGDSVGYISQRGDSDAGSSTFADNLANAAIKRGGGTTKSGGKCALAVGDAFSSVVGEKEARQYRGNAWTWISKLKSKGAKWFNYAGIAGSDRELKGIPKGSIAVWDKQSAHPYGHIEIADGRGNLISDFKRPAN